MALLQLEFHFPFFFLVSFFFFAQFLQLLQFFVCTFLCKSVLNSILALLFIGVTHTVQQCQGKNGYKSLKILRFFFFVLFFLHSIGTLDKSFYMHFLHCVCCLFMCVIYLFPSIYRHEKKNEKIPTIWPNELRAGESWDNFDLFLFDWSRKIYISRTDFSFFVFFFCTLLCECCMK